MASDDLIICPLKFIMFSRSSFLEDLSSLSLDDIASFAYLSSTLAFSAISHLAKRESFLASSFSFLALVFIMIFVLAI